MAPCANPKHEPKIFRVQLVLQDQLWIDRHGCEQDPRAIDLSYAENLLHYLRRRFNRTAQWRVIDQLYLSTVAGYDFAGDMAQDAIDAEAQEVLDGLGLTPEEWLVQYSPLFQLLLKRVTDGAERSAT